MKKYLLAGSLALVAVGAQAGTLYKGPVVESTGYLYTDGWKTCEVEVLERSLEAVKVRLQLGRDQEPRVSSKEVLLTKKGKNSSLLDRLLFHYGAVSYVDSETFHQTVQDRVRFRDQERMTYLLRLSQQSKDRMRSMTISLECDLSKNSEE